MSIAPTTPRRAVGYARVSTKRQAMPDRSSLQDQERDIRRLVAEWNLELDALWFEVASAGDVRNRRVYCEMIAYCYQNPQPIDRLGVVVVADTSRFTRMPLAMALQEQNDLRAHGWLVRGAREELDPCESSLLLRNVIDSLVHSGGDLSAVYGAVQ